MNRAIKDFRFRNSDFGKSRRCQPSAASQSLDSTNHKSQFLNQTSPSSRRGILLLVVLTMLTLFLLIGTAYLVSASHFRKMNKVMARSVENQALELVEASLLDQVINQLVRDTKNPFSALRFHSLLRDMYGSDYFRIDMNSDPEIQFIDRDNFSYTDDLGNNVTAAMLDNRMNLTGNQFFWVAVEFNLSPINGLPTLSLIDNYYNGSLFTFVEGELEGVSARVVHYEYVESTSTTGFGNGIFTLMPVNSDSLIISSDLTTAAAGDTNMPTDWENSSAIINGKPFNGTGFGFNRFATTGPRLNAIEQVLDTTGSLVDRPLGLMPSGTFLNSDNITPEFLFTEKELLDLNYTSLSADQQNILKRERIAQVGLSGLGGSDESYDAPDFQNVALGMLPYEQNGLSEVGDPANQALVDPATGRQMALPSFHRPALINFWKQLLISEGTTVLEEEPNLLRKVLLRPNWHDHPNFTGSNPNYASTLAGITAGTHTREDLLDHMIYGPWDVDNDNDGVRDSVWIDFGAPAIPGPDGKMVKPLAAVLVLDMDGRLNLNAHGSAELAGVTSTAPTPQTLAGGVMTNTIPKGEGYGPADISLAPVVGKRDEWFVKGVKQERLIYDPDPDNETGYILNGDEPKYQRDIPSKFGPAVVSTPTSTVFPGDGDEGSNTGYFDSLAQLKMQGMPRYYDRISNYGTPPDIKARYAMPGLNDLGQPVFEAQYEATLTNPAELDQDSPYEINLSAEISRGEDPNSIDKAFSLTELERLLRAYDTDTGTLPDRLWQLAGNFLPSETATTPSSNEVNKWRTLLTTDSYDLPVPNVIVPEWMVEDGVNGSMNDGDEYLAVMGKLPVNASFADLLEYRFRASQSPVWIQADDDANPTRLPQIQRLLAFLMPQDLANGVRMDVNRPFGNGRDDDNNGVVDEPGEDEGAYWAIDRTRMSNASAALNSFEQVDISYFHDAKDRDGDGTISRFERGDFDGDDDPLGTFEERVVMQNLRRQDMARDMFVLAMTLVDPIITDPNNITTEQKAKIRKIAQWAINSVDFRDPDNIMTAFEYDENPFDGWGVDGNLTTDDSGLTTRGVVWGTERPELLITETLAWHDRRTEDTRLEGELSILEPGDGTMPADVGSGGVSDPNRDTSFDQRERPQGAAFIELYNPWPQNPAACSDIHDMHTSPGNDMGVDLARTHNDTISNQDPSTGSPVWRVMVYKFGGFGKTPEAPESSNRPTNHSGVHLAHRSIYFVGRDPGYDDDGVAYYNDLETTLDAEENPVPPVRPGRYLVIGSGEKIPGTNEYLAKFGEEEGTRTGSNRGIMMMPRDPRDPGDTRPMSIALQSASGGYVMDSAMFEVTAPSEADAMGVLGSLSGNTNGFTASVAIIDQCFDTNGGATKDCRFTFSEPAGGYPDRIQIESLTRGGWTTSSAWDSTQNRYVPTIDVPLDDQRLALGGGGGLGVAPGRTSQLQDNETRLSLPQSDANNHERTIPGFSWIYMQRLANPTLPWNPEIGNISHNPSLAVNPYLTIDSMGVNMTVFNGLNRDERRVDTANRTGTPNRYRNVNARSTFASLQRGRRNDYRDPAATFEDRLDQLTRDQERVQLGRSLNEIDPNAAPNLVANLWTNESTAVLAANNAGVTFDGMDNGDTTHNFTGIPDNTLGFLNEPFRGNTTSAAPADIRDRLIPQQPFPLLTWNNRPYVSANELMQVPAYPPSQAMQTFSMRASNESYDNNTTELSDQINLHVDSPYGHLMNFFRTEPGTTAGREGIVGMYRVLDYLHTPSPFVGTETWFNPQNFGQNITDVSDPRYGLQPPFNRISAYRDPGRVNLNTIVDADVWDGLFHDNSGALVEHESPRWDDTADPNFITSRRGYGNSERKFLLNATVPTFFANPFRSASTGDRVPLPNMVQNKEINCTLLREEGNTPLFAGNENNAHNNTDRNSYFRYQPMTRLDNLTTTRSNVYAVWVTIGFFEVEEAPTLADFINTSDPSGILNGQQQEELYNQVYPEGYQLGKEYGIETGDIRRVRQFAIIDRSIPVAFEPGANHNVEKAIRLKRRIE